MINKHLLEQRWARYASRDLAGLSPEELLLCHDAFFAGAIHLFAMLFRGVFEGRDPGEAEIRLAMDLGEELNEAAKLMMEEQR